MGSTPGRVFGHLHSHAIGELVLALGECLIWDDELAQDRCHTIDPIRRYAPAG
jgi:hypothetical protein